MRELVRACVNSRLKQSMIRTAFDVSLGSGGATGAIIGNALAASGGDLSSFDPAPLKDSKRPIWVCGACCPWPWPWP